MREQMATVPSLWATAEKFASARNVTHALRAWGSGSWSKGCHFWSNMEVGSLSFFRGEAYQAWFSAADAAGGFVNERWGDAPVQTLGLMMLAPSRDALKYLPELGYQHPPNFRCPRSGTCQRRGVPVECTGELFAGCTRDIGDGLNHEEGCDFYNNEGMLE
jgi:alpha 1,2-mannosyltransferase